MGQIRADEGVVPGGRQSRSRGADVGRSQADEDRDRDPGQTKTVAGEETETQTETGADVMQGLGQRLRRVDRFCLCFLLCIII